MPSRTITGAGFSDDIVAFLRLLAKRRVRYLVVGGEAVIFHGYPRVTGDVDFFYENSAANVGKLYAVLLDFWENNIPGVHSAAELRAPRLVIQFGRPPHRIDLMNHIDGVSFVAAWRSRITVRLQTPSGSVPIRYISLARLVRNKRASGRSKDSEDARFLSGLVKAQPKRTPR